MEAYAWRLNLRSSIAGRCRAATTTARYCPFAKQHETRGRAARRPRGARRASSAGSAQRPDGTLSVLFTPWGEALIRRWYQQALVAAEPPAARRQGRDPDEPVLPARLGRDCDRRQARPVVHLSSRADDRGQRSSANAASWTQRGVRFSVGVVGLHEHIDEIEALRAELPTRRLPVDQRLQGRARLLPPQQSGRGWQRVDPLFPDQQYTARFAEPSLPRRARRGLGGRRRHNLRRCHFVDADRQPLRGGLADGARPAHPARTRPAAATSATCCCPSCSTSGCSAAACWSEFQILRSGRTGTSMKRSSLLTRCRDTAVPFQNCVRRLDFRYPVVMVPAVISACRCTCSAVFAGIVLICLAASDLRAQGSEPEAQPAAGPAEEVFRAALPGLSRGQEAQGRIPPGEPRCGLLDKANRERWLAVLEQVKAGAMPPKEKPRPPAKDVAGPDRLDQRAGGSGGGRPQCRRRAGSSCAGSTGPSTRTPCATCWAWTSI